MCRAVQDENLGSVTNLNEVLGSQLQKVLDERMHLKDAHDSPSPSVPQTDRSSEPPSLNESNDKKEDDMPCLGCKRATRSRGAYCEAGSHWIHYFCNKLRESDIARLHNDPGFIYV